MSILFSTGIVLEFLAGLKVSADSCGDSVGGCKAL